MFCPYCGTQNNDDLAFCIECGKPLMKPASQAPSADRNLQPAEIVQRNGALPSAYPEHSYEWYQENADTPNGAYVIFDDADEALTEMLKVKDEIDKKREQLDAALKPQAPRLKKTWLVYLIAAGATFFFIMPMLAIIVEQISESSTTAIVAGLFAILAAAVLLILGLVTLGKAKKERNQALAEYKESSAQVDKEIQEYQKKAELEVESQYAPILEFFEPIYFNRTDISKGKKWLSTRMAHSYADVTVMLEREHDRLDAQARHEEQLLMQQYNAEMIASEARGAKRAAIVSAVFSGIDLLR